MTLIQANVPQQFLDLRRTRRTLLATSETSRTASRASRLIGSSPRTKHQCKENRSRRLPSSTDLVIVMRAPVRRSLRARLRILKEPSVAPPRVRIRTPAAQFGTAAFVFGGKAALLAAPRSRSSANVERLVVLFVRRHVGLRARLLGARCRKVTAQRGFALGIGLAPSTRRARPASPRCRGRCPWPGSSGPTACSSAPWSAASRHCRRAE